MDTKIVKNCLDKNQIAIYPYICVIVLFDKVVDARGK